jgi:hypothetical protein
VSGSISDEPFTVAVGQWVDLAKSRALAAYQATALDALARVRELTPVRTGYLRANWTIVLDSDPMPIAGQTEDDASIVARLTLQDTIILANPVVYARRIEFGFIGTDSLGRYYNQPGSHMMAQTIAEMPDIAHRATERVIAGMGDV